MLCLPQVPACPIRSGGDDVSTREERAEQARRDAINEADYLASDRPRPLGPGAFATGQLAPALEPDDRARGRT